MSLGGSVYGGDTVTQRLGVAVEFHGYDFTNESGDEHVGAGLQLTATGWLADAAWLKVGLGGNERLRVFADDGFSGADAEGKSLSLSAIWRGRESHSG